MAGRRGLSPFVIAAAVGMASWFVSASLAGQREAWDAPVYWALAYPVAILTSAALGYAHAKRPWRWPLVLFEAQFVAMCIRNGEIGNLWPLGMALLAVMALPGVVVAGIASRLGPAARVAASGVRR